MRRAPVDRAIEKDHEQDDPDPRQVPATVTPRFGTSSTSM
jgi:hypothetical protein